MSRSTRVDGRTVYVSTTDEDRRLLVAHEGVSGDRMHTDRLYREQLGRVLVGPVGTDG